MAKRKKYRAVSELSRKGKKSHKRRKRGMREGGLSSAFSVSSLQGSGKALFSGVIGGVLGGALSNRLLKDSTPLMRMGSLGVLSLLFGSVLKMPNVGAGIGGAIGRELFSAPKPLSEGENVDYIKNYPRYLMEGNENTQLSAGNYMNEGTQLSEEDYLASLGIARAYGM